ncbi:bifunctional proline dehydrogenase/L-glutamate gamma-semialdehyde dehydrogenase PutA [Roseateles paludis]|uniref:Bifunctional protein PutA n=1 Tax=Roseateles paludis TaxID=3145238 RepID=A0ABV0FZQ9_9BURK
MFACPPEAQRLPDPYRDEAEVVEHLAALLAGQLDWPSAQAAATPWVAQVRAHPAPFWALESLLREYPISSNEGLALMRLAESLLRVPDTPTAIALTADQLGRAAFDADADGPHKLLAALASSAIGLSKQLLPGAQEEGGLFKRLGAQTVVAATVRAIQLLGRQFVLGRNIEEAQAEAAAARRSAAHLRFSFDMLGEGARTEPDAERYLASYAGALQALAAQRMAGAGPEAADGISIKLSALFSRYEVLQRERVFTTLLPRVWQLVQLAAEANLNLTLDAEEAERLELSLDVFDALAARIAAEHPQWRGFGLAVQAYQTRALAVIDHVAATACRHGLRFMVRLVKGAYWDAEIKRAQELGLGGYPVFTHKPHTDLSYLACAARLIAHRELIYPQFATHNAATLAAVAGLAQAAGARFELQRLHGMGEALYREFAKTHPDVPVRVYAPVGEHRDLLAYLVRRLLENGANSSFVHQLCDPELPIEQLLASPLDQVLSTPGLPLPAQLFEREGRRNSMGLDFTELAPREALQQALTQADTEPVPKAGQSDVEQAMARLQAAAPAWAACPVLDRAACLRRAADALEAQTLAFCARLTHEAGKTAADAMAEVREAVDFLRYYAGQAEQDPALMRGRGVFVCISPWNFPLAIFAGQMAAALVAGNAVAAKPAEQTPAVARAMVALLHEAGVPRDALQLLHGPGERVGAALVAHAACAGVSFTGSTAVAQHIHRALAAQPGPPRPLIAETGGLNAMVVDSTALPEQVIDAVVQSAFRSAGQRCSALRLLCLHDGIADRVIEMLRGAMAELRVGSPARLDTDVGPLIDDEAHVHIARHVLRLRREARFIAESPLAEPHPRLLAPIAFEIGRIDELREEIFGPVLHVLRWQGEPEGVIDAINALGYGLTLGLQTRIDSRAERLAALARVGNVYVNRNIVGAVVGVQPFGGEGLSGTGPKAGGPSYLRRFVAEPALRTSLPPLHLAWPAASIDLPVDAAWAATPLLDRLALLRHAACPLLAPLWPAALAQLDELQLPGPTGERNTLRHRARGHVVVIGLGEAGLAAAASALLAGNSLSWIGGSEAELRPWREAGLPLMSARVLPPEALPGLLAAPALAGLALASSDAEAAAPLARHLAARPGPLVPLILSAGHPQQLYRFAAEQTLTVNTAAAGGNAALLASGVAVRS